MATTNRLFQLIPKISWLYAAAYSHIDLLAEAEDLVEVDKKSTSAEIGLGAAAELFEHSHNILLTSTPLLTGIAQRQEGRAAGAILFFRYCRMDTPDVYETKISKTPELVIQLKLSISSWEPGIDN